MKLITLTFFLLIISLSGNGYSDSLNREVPSKLNDAQTYRTHTLRVINHSPVINLFNLPQADFHDFKDNGSISWRSYLDITNHISRTVKGNDSLALDGESWKYTNVFSYQLNRQWQIALETNYLRHFGGKADRLIYDFHDIFSLPQNGRSDDLHDRLYWSIYADGQELVSLNSDVSGIADSALVLNWQPEQFESTQVNFVIKIPTGELEKYTGSEEIDVNVSFSNMNPKWFKQRSLLNETALSFWYGAGIGYVGQIKQHAGLNQNTVVASFRTGLGWMPYSHFEMLAQLDTHSPLYDTKLRELGWYPVQFSIAARYFFNQAAHLGFTIVEDLRPRSAPDVTFSTSLGIDF